MSRTRKDIHDTENMLQRLTSLLAAHATSEAIAHREFRTDAEALRRISMTLHRWHELECGDGNDHGAWCIVRGRKERTKGATGKTFGEAVFVHDDDGKPFIERHHYRHGAGKDSVSYTLIHDRESGARKRLASIMKNYPTLTAYVQTDPRGCALYICKPGDVPPGADIGSYYSRGLAVFQ